MHANVRSFVTKMHQVRYSILRNQFPIFVITETWVDISVNSEVVSIPGCDVIRQDRGERSGDILLYYRNDLRVKVLNNNEVSEVEHISKIASVNFKTLGIIYLYRSTSIPYIRLNVLADLITYINPRVDHLNIIGDLNWDQLVLRK